jgi:hypothetical protein
MVNNNNGFPDPTELVRKQREAHKKESLKETLATWRAEAKFKKPAIKKKKKVKRSFIVSLARKRVRLPSAPKRVAKKYILGKRITYKIRRVK